MHCLHRSLWAQLHYEEVLQGCARCTSPPSPYLYFWWHCWSPTPLPRRVPTAEASLAQAVTVVVVTAAPIPLSNLP